MESGASTVFGIQYRTGRKSHVNVRAMASENDVCGTMYTASAAMGTTRPAVSTNTPVGALHCARIAVDSRVIFISCS